ncbi:FAD binding domain-containing protein [Xylariomycetidae sp. FL0641]|nr:FAD binding domain-containing protein [Xylariomycetidae sp. FL0641]
MLSNTILNALAVFASTAAAIPTLRTSSGDELVRFLRRATAPDLNFTMSSGAEVLTPDSDNWANETMRWSTWSAPSYSVAFLPATEDDITTALQYMTSHNISFLAQGGGHGNTITLAHAQNTVMINMEKFDDIHMNDDDTISIGGGAIFGPVYTVAQNAGRELPLGSCGCVGVGGASLGGGHGRLQGKYGLIVDAIASLRVALWNGTIVEASADANPDLFWGMRGAGHNYGIVTEFTFNTWPLQNGGMQYNADMTFTPDSFTGVLAVINDLIPDQDENLALDFFALTDPGTNETVVFLNIVYAGTQEEGAAYTARFASGATSSAGVGRIERTQLNETMAAWDQLAHVAANGMIDLACTEGLSYNVYTANLATFDLAQQQDIFDSYRAFVAAHPAASASILFYEIFAQQAVTAVPADATAFANRDLGNILALFQTTYTDPSVAPAADAWAKGVRDEVVKPEHSGYDRESVYMNYAHGDEPIESLYGYEDWRIQRLRSLKQQYDPRGVFNFYNSVLGINR